jgi:hypothetical protein
MSAGLKATTISSFLSATVHSAVLVAAPQVTIVQCFLGFALYAVSLMLFWWAAASNQRQPLLACFTPVWPSHITVKGPYRLVRHPFYCSYVLAWLAGFVGTGNLWLLLTMAAMSASYGLAALRESRSFQKARLRRSTRSTANAPECSFRAFVISRRGFFWAGGLLARIGMDCGGCSRFLVLRHRNLKAAHTPRTRWEKRVA